MINDQTINELKQAREEADELKKKSQALLNLALLNPEYVDALNAARKSAEYVQELEGHIHHEALSSFRLDGNKSPHDKVAVKMFKVVEPYDDVAAREWCFLNFRPALRLDDKTFEKAAKDGSIPDELATVSEEPRVQIATKL